MADQLNDPGVPNAPPSIASPEPTTVERIRDDLFYGFRSYHTPIREQRALVESLIEAARLEGRQSGADIATRDELRMLFHSLRTAARDETKYDDATWTRFADLLGLSGADSKSAPPDGGDA